MLPSSVSPRRMGRLSSCTAKLWAGCFSDRAANRALTVSPEFLKVATNFGELALKVA